MIRVVAVALTLVFAASACSSSPSRSDALADIVDKYAIPKYELANERANEMVRKVSDACVATPDAVKDASNALIAARDAWGATESVWMGPVMDERISSQVDYPVNATRVEELIADQNVQLTPDNLTRRAAANQRGLAALEYVINTGSLSEQRRCDYAKANAALIAQATKNAHDAWTTGYKGAPAYRQTFLDDSDKALDEVVNDSVNLTQLVGELEIETSIGTAKRSADVSALREGPTGTAAQFDIARIEGSKAVVTGNAEQEGLSELLGTDLNKKVTDAYDAALVALRDIDGSFVAAAAGDRAAVQNVVDKMKALHALLSTEVISKLGVTAGFSASDGDSTG